LSQIMKYIIGVTLLITGIFSFLYYQEVKEEQRQWETFINHFYHSISKSKDRLDALIEKQPKNEKLEPRISLLEREISTAETILDHGHSYLDRDIYYGFHLFKPFSSFLNGIKYSSNGTVRLELPPMAEDGRLDDKEVTLLIALRDILIEAREAMYSPVTGQENPDLTVEEFNEIIKITFDRDELEIYRDTFK
jgi:hypothetical protein